MSSWERILNLYFLLVELCCGAVIVTLLIEMGVRWYRSKKSRKSSTYIYHPVDGQRYYDCKHDVWYRYENGKWMKNE